MSYREKPANVKKLKAYLAKVVGPKEGTTDHARKEAQTTQKQAL